MVLIATHLWSNKNNVDKNYNWVMVCKKIKRKFKKMYSFVLKIG